MEYEELFNLITCKFCNETYKDPVVLPCGETLCKKDIEKLSLENERACLFCTEEHDLSLSYPINRLLLKLIKSNVENYFSMSKSYDRTKKICMNLKDKFDEYYDLLYKPVDYLNEHFDLLKKQIDLCRNKIHLVIEKRYDQMVRDLDMFKAECQSSIESKNSKPKSELDNEVIEKSIEFDNLNKRLNQWIYDLNEFNFHKEQMLNEIYQEAHFIQKDFEHRIDVMKNQLFIGMSCQFDPLPIDSNANLFGNLKLVINNN